MPQSAAHPATAHSAPQERFYPDLAGRAAGAAPGRPPGQPGTYAVPASFGRTAAGSRRVRVHPRYLPLSCGYSATPRRRPGLLTQLLLFVARAWRRIWTGGRPTDGPGSRTDATLSATTPPRPAVGHYLNSTAASCPPALQTIDEFTPHDPAVVLLGPGGDYVRRWPPTEGLR